MNDDMQEVLDSIVEVCQELILEGATMQRSGIDINDIGQDILNIIKPQKEEQNEQS